jgi:phenylpyruvate tautomerase
MPYLRLETNVGIQNEEKFLKDLSNLIAKSLNKPERYVMVSVETKKMIFDGKADPCAVLELKSIGFPKDKAEKLSGELCDFVEKNTGVRKERIYLNFVDFDGSMWGWNGATF